jgi:hypothetical protein
MGIQVGTVDAALFTYDAALDEWDRDAKLREVNQPNVRGSWGWWAEHLSGGGPRCATCQHAEPTDRGLGDGAFLCRAFGRGTGDYRLEVDDSDGRVFDFEPIVAADFGCVAWESKDEKAASGDASQRPIAIFKKPDVSFVAAGFSVGQIIDVPTSLPVNVILADGSIRASENSLPGRYRVLKVADDALTVEPVLEAKP